MGAMGRSTDSFPFGVGFFTRPWRVRQEQSACFYDSWRVLYERGYAENRRG